MSNHTKTKKTAKKKIEARGVRGMKSTPWRKTFRDVDALMKWAGENDAIVHETADVEPDVAPPISTFKAPDCDGGFARFALIAESSEVPRFYKTQVEAIAAGKKIAAERVNASIFYVVRILSTNDSAQWKGSRS